MKEKEGDCYLDLKKKHVLEVASHFFLEKGYQHASMQDIAEGCNMSKATLYKYFSSKEEIGLDVVHFMTEQLLFEVQNIMRKEGLSKREKLRECIILRTKHFGDRSRFIDALLYAFSVDQKEKYITSIYQTRFQIFHTFAHIVAEGFQLDNDMIAWEIAINLNGLIKEITFVSRFGNITIDEKKLSEFIMDSLEAIVKNREGKTPFITQEQMEQLKQLFTADDKAFQPIFQRHQLLKRLREMIEQYEDLEKRKRLSEAVHVLEQEYHKPMPRQIIVEALLVYLEQESLLAQSVQELKCI